MWKKSYIWKWTYFFVDHEVQDRNEEKNELAKALTRSYEELQKVRTNSAQVSFMFSGDLPQYDSYMT